MGRIKGKIALITGGSKGIGAGIARLFAKEGALVIVTDILKLEGESLANEVGGLFYSLDVSNESDWKNVTKIIKDKFGRLDILVNNAGVNLRNKKQGKYNPENMCLDEWIYIHKINLDSVFLGCKYAINLMKANGGSIINMSSRYGFVGSSELSAYASTKAAIINYTKSVALYSASMKYKIRCNCLCPAFILTSMLDDITKDNGILSNKKIEKIKKYIPLGHLGDIEDVAYGALYLASDESKYVTGTSILIDGGVLSGVNYYYNNN